MNKIVFFDGENAVLFLGTKDYPSADGSVMGLNCFFAADDTGTELQTGTCEFEVQLNGGVDFTFSKNRKFKVYGPGDELFGTFFVSEAKKIRKSIYEISAVSSIGKLQDFKANSAFIVKFPYEQTNISSGRFPKDYAGMSLDDFVYGVLKDTGITYEIDAALENETINTAYITNGGSARARTLRELFQSLAFEKNYVISDFKSDGITIKPCARGVTKLVSGKIDFDSIFEDYDVEDSGNQNIGVISLLKNVSCIPIDPDHMQLTGYAALNGYAETVVSPYDENFVAGESYVNGDGIIKPPVNDYYGDFNGKFVVTGGLHYDDYTDSAGGNANTSDYVVFNVYSDGSVSYKIDEQKLQRFMSYVPFGERAKKTIDGKDYVLISFSWIRVTETQTETEKIVLKDGKIENENEIQSGVNENGDESEIDLYFSDKDAKMSEAFYEKLNACRSRKLKVNAKLKYSGFSLGDIFSVYDIEDEPLYALLQKADMRFSASNIFADCEFTVLSEAEAAKITGIKYGGAKYGKVKYGQKIYVSGA